MSLSVDHLRRVLHSRFEVSEDGLSLLASALIPRRLERGQPLAVPGHRLAVAGIVTQGCLRVYFTEPDGSDRVLYFAPEGWCVADIDVAAREGPTAVTIEALEPTDVWLFESGGRTVPADLSNYERVCRALAESALLTLQQRLVGSMRKTAEQRYREFQDLYPGLDSRISQYHVAAYLGVTPEFLSKLRKRLLHVS